MQSQQQKPNPQSGESLLEVMISLLIFCFAILGLMGTQQRMLVQMFQTESAIIANQFTASLAEQIGGLPALVITQLDGSTNTVAQLACPIDSCNSDWVNAQLADWQRKLENELPESQLMICLDDTPADGLPEQPACRGTGRIAVKIWPQHQQYPMVAALDL